MLLTCALLFGCTPSTPQDEVPEPSTENAETKVVNVNVDNVLLNNDYEKYNGMFIRLVELDDASFYYVFLTNLNEFAIVNAYTNENYNTSIVSSNGTYIDTLLDEELVRVGLKRDDFLYVNHAVIGYSQIDMGEKLLADDAINVYQTLIENGYTSQSGYYVKSFDFGKVAFNLKQRTVTLSPYDEDIYYQYSPDLSYHLYTYADGECTYNKYAGISTNCYDSDKVKITDSYKKYIEPILDELEINLFDLELYYTMMIDNGTWSSYQVNRYDIYPSLNENIVGVDEDVATYVYKEFVRHDADIRSTSVRIDFRGKDAVFYFEDKTFTYGDSNLVYDWRNEVVHSSSCIYDFNEGIGCSEQEIEKTKELRYTLSHILDDYWLLKKELHIYANSRRLYDKTLGGYKNVE